MTFGAVNDVHGDRECQSAGGCGERRAVSEGLGRK